MRTDPFAGHRFLTDGGLETTLLFKEGFELPDFAAFLVFDTVAGRNALQDYYLRYLDVARDHDLGFVLEAPTWRASPDWAVKHGYGPAALADLNRRTIEWLRDLRDERTPWHRAPILVAGCVGPRGDGYVPGVEMSVDEAAAYHQLQVRAFAEAGADVVDAMTITTISEATGIALAASAFGLPAAISFTVETDGKLPTGDSLKDAIEAVDAATGGYPVHYMINCAHPTHFALSDAGWVHRICGLRANASRRSHAELDASPDLDEGDPDELGHQHGELTTTHQHLRVLGGCCGTDVRHVRSIARAWAR